MITKKYLKRCIKEINIYINCLDIAYKKELKEILSNVILNEIEILNMYIEDKYNNNYETFFNDVVLKNKESNIFYYYCNQYIKYLKEEYNL